MFQRRSIMQRAYRRLCKIALGLSGFFLLQYLIFSLPFDLGNRPLLHALWPIACLIVLALFSSFDFTRRSLKR